MALTQPNNRLRSELERRLCSYLFRASRNNHKYNWTLESENGNRMEVDNSIMHELTCGESNFHQIYRFSPHYPSTTYSSYCNDSVPTTATQNHDMGWYLQNPPPLYYQPPSDMYSSKYLVSSYGTSIPVSKPVENKAKSAKLRKLFWHRFTKLGHNPLE